METSRIKEIISNVIATDVEEMKDTDTLANDLGADSIDIAEIMMEIEKEERIDIADTYYIEGRTGQVKSNLTIQMISEIVETVKNNGTRKV